LGSSLFTDDIPTRGKNGNRTPEEGNYLRIIAFPWRRQKTNSEGGKKKADESVKGLGGGGPLGEKGHYQQGEALLKLFYTLLEKEEESEEFKIVCGYTVNTSSQAGPIQERAL